ncbi:MAG: hypothetical protein WBW78_09985, partial [Terrimicrobiaceae bacterium]
MEDAVAREGFLENFSQDRLSHAYHCSWRKALKGDLRKKVLRKGRLAGEYLRDLFGVGSAIARAGNIYP